MSSRADSSPGEEHSRQQARMTVARKELIRNGSDTQFRVMLNDLLAFSARLESIRQRFGASIGLSEVQYSLVMSVLHLQEGDGVGVSAIARHLSLSNSFVTNETGKLIKLGLMEKHTNPDDRRRVLLSLTKKGCSLLGDLAPLQRDVNDALFACLSGSDFDYLKRLSRELVQTADDAVALVEYLTGSGR